MADVPVLIRLSPGLSALARFGDVPYFYKKGGEKSQPSSDANEKILVKEGSERGAYRGALAKKEALDYDSNIKTSGINQVNTDMNTRS